MHTWPAQTTKMCRTQSSCKNLYTLSQGLSQNFVRIFVLQNLSTERFFSNMTATETAIEKVRYMYSTFLQVLQTDCRSLFLLWRHETLFGAVQSRRYSQIINQTASDSSKQIQSHKYEIFTRRDCTHWLVSYEANKFTEPLHNGDFP